MAPLIYLALPYTHDNPDVRRFRFRRANEAAGALIEKGLLVFSPISHSHPIAQVADLPKEFTFWQAWNKEMLSRCTELSVLMLDGWEESRGVTWEIDMARDFGMAVKWLPPDFGRRRPAR